jgi:dTDP-4-amino-4,6-dideoxygalactose transaminase
VLCDTFNIDPAKIEEKISEKTKAILPVHIFGQPAQMNEIIDIASRHGLYVVEDACQAMGAEYNGNKAGTIGDMGCFSFFPTKNLSCFGDGGLITTNSERNAKILRALRAHGGGKNGEDAFKLLNENSSEHVYNLPDSDMGKYYNYMIGYNSRLDEIQAAILRIKLKYLDQWNLRRRNLAERYDDLLKNTDLVTQKSIPSVKSIFHQYIVQSERKDELCQFLKSKGVSTGVYYPVPLHLQVAYKHLGYKVDELPVSEYLSKRTLALPVYPELSSEDQDYIADCIYKFEQI